MTTAMQLAFSTADHRAGSLTPRPSNHHWVSPAPWTVTDAAETAGAGLELPPRSPSVRRGAAMGRRILVAVLSAIRVLLGWGGRRRRLPRGRVGFLGRDKKRSMRSVWGVVASWSWSTECGRVAASITFAR